VTRFFTTTERSNGQLEVHDHYVPRPTIVSIYSTRRAAIPGGKNEIVPDKLLERIQTDFRGRFIAYLPRGDYYLLPENPADTSLNQSMAAPTIVAVGKCPREGPFVSVILMYRRDL
jgi:hypothetical protein